MRENRFKSGNRIGDNAFQTIDNAGTTPCASDDNKVREGAHCSTIGKRPSAQTGTTSSSRKSTATGRTKSSSTGSKTTTAKVSQNDMSPTNLKKNAEAGLGYSMSVGGEMDVPPQKMDENMGSTMKTRKPASTSKSSSKSASASTRRPSTASTRKSGKASAEDKSKSTSSARSNKSNNDDYVLVEEIIIITEE